MSVDAMSRPAGSDVRPADAGWPRAALFSLSDKAGAVEFARTLAAHGTRLVASGGTARTLEAAGLAVTPVEKLTGFAELLGGRVKTLHPHVHAGILARRDVAGDLAELAARGIEPIDLVCVSLYPFEAKAKSLDEAGAIEEIDIGGVALLRGAAKNFAHVVVLHDPAQYAAAEAAFARGGPTHEERRAWALATFARTARYDAAIAAELERRAGGGDDAPPAFHVLALERVRALRYGENPHQKAALYARLGDAARLEAWKEGKELSYNNLVDLESAVALAGRFERPACVIVKHTQPCGAACADTLEEAWRAALASDEQSAFGGIVAFNGPLDGATARAMAGRFLECVAAPDFAPEVEEELRKKKSLRLVKLDAGDLAGPDRLELRTVGPWALLQTGDAPGGGSLAGMSGAGWRVPTKRQPTNEEMIGLRFAWEVVAAARSNAIALARGQALIGLGSGQTSRVDAVDVALMKGRRAGHEVKGAVLASDGFFPFADSVSRAAEAGVAAIVQPAGSVKDDEVVAEADRHGIAMVFTGRRTFRH